MTSTFGGAVPGRARFGAPAAPGLPPNARRVAWSGHSTDGTTVSGFVTVLIKPRARPPASFADGSNRTDDLAAYLNSAPPGSIVDLTGMSIRCDQTVTITKPVVVHGGLIWTDDVTGDASSPTAPSTASRTRTHLRVKDTHDVTLDGVEVRGPNVNGGLAETAYVAALEAQHAFEVLSSSRVTLRGCTGSYIYGDGLYVGRSLFNSPDPTDLLAEDLHIHHNGRQGIGVAAGKRLTFRRPVLEEIRRTVMDTEPNDNNTIIEDVEVDGMRFGNHRLNWFSAASSSGVCRRMWIHNSAPVTPGLPSAGAPATIGNESLRNPNRQGPWTFERNVTDSGFGTPSGWIWTFTKIDGVHVRDNSIAGQPGRGMHLGKATNCTDVQQSGNQVPGGTGDIVEVTV